jgi:hypothetical protein
MYAYQGIYIYMIKAKVDKTTQSDSGLLFCLCGRDFGVFVICEDCVCFQKAEEFQILNVLIRSRINSMLSSCCEDSFERMLSCVESISNQVE